MGSESDELEELRREIDVSRENLGQAVGALAYKADVKNRGKEVISDKKEQIMEKVEDLKSKLPSGDGEGTMGDTIKGKLPSGEQVSEKVDALKDKVPGGVGDAAAKVSDATPSTEDVKAKAQEAASVAGDHPLAVAAGATVAGLAAGLALPETDIEREKLAPAARSAREQVQSGVQDAVQHAKQVAQDAASSAADAVKQAGQQQGGKVGEIAEKAADKTQERVD